MFLTLSAPARMPMTGRDWGLLAAVLVVFIGLAAGAARTKAPSNDEGNVANQAWTLATEGRMRVTILIDKRGPGIGIDKRAYWIAPLQPVVLGAWFRALGFGLGPLRALSILWGVIALSAFFVLLDRLSGRRAIALLGAAMLALTYTFLDSGSYGRMDMMAAALGLSGWAAYLYWRDEHFERAILLSQTGVMLSGVTHWGGLFWALGLLLITVALDARRLRFKHLALAAIPYLLGALGWGAFIAEDPAEFRRQFFANASASGRMSGFRAPWLGVWREFTERYPTSYGLGGHTAGNRGPLFLKAAMLGLYVLAVLANLRWKPLRAQAPVKLLLLLTGLFFLLMAIIDGQKLSLYLIHIVPLYTALVALFAATLWDRRTIPRWLTVAVLLGVLAIDTGGLLYRMRQNAYRNIYLPVGEALRAVAPPGSRVYGHGSLYFLLAEGYDYRDDSYLGYQDGRVPDYYVMDETWDVIHAEQQELHAALGAHIARIRGASQLIYRNPVYALYAYRKQP